MRIVQLLIIALLGSYVWMKPQIAVAKNSLLGRWQTECLYDANIDGYTIETTTFKEGNLTDVYVKTYSNEDCSVLQPGSSGLNNLKYEESPEFLTIWSTNPEIKFNIKLNYQVTSHRLFTTPIWSRRSNGEVIDVSHSIQKVYYR